MSAVVGGSVVPGSGWCVRGPVGTRATALAAQRQSPRSSASRKDSSSAPSPPPRGAEGELELELELRLKLMLVVGPMALVCSVCTTPTEGAIFGVLIGHSCTPTYPMCCVKQMSLLNKQVKSPHQVGLDPVPVELRAYYSTGLYRYN